MRNRVRRSTVLLFLMGFLLVGGSAASIYVRPALAQTCTGGNPATFSVNPSVVSNTTTTTVVVATSDGGYNFTNGVSVTLSGYGTLSATATGTSAVDVDIPAGIAPGTYQLQVTSTTPAACVPLGLTIVGGTATPLPTNFVRPIVVVLSYGPSSSPLQPGQTFALEVNIINTGQLPASNILVTFFPGDFEPRETGGVRSEGTLQPGEQRKIIQVFTAKDDLATGLAILDAQIEYVDPYGVAYTETVRLTLDIVRPAAGGPGATRTPTPTATSVARPLLVIEDYDIDIDQIQPGSTFTLTITARNLGAAEARNTSLIIGGGSASSGGDNSGTPGAGDGGGGGISGGSSELTNFAPLGSSNVLFLGNIPAGSTVEARITLITSATLTPNLYSLRMSFVYVDPAGRNYADDQIITLLVYRPPDVAISFYTQPFCFVEQPCNLPIQLLNLARDQAVLGEMVVSAENAEPLNDRTVIGALDPGFPFTFDATLLPHEAGPMDVLVTINYRDDFNQEQTITETLTVPVEEGGPVEPGAEGGMDSGQFPPGEGPGFEEPGVATEETAWDKFVRFMLGLLGLDSAPPQPGGEQFFPPEGMPTEGAPPQEGVPIEVPAEPAKGP